MSWEKQTNGYERTIRFQTQKDLAECVMRIALLSDALDHHADMTIEKCSTLVLSISSHDVGGITERDENWIKLVDELLPSE